MKTIIAGTRTITDKELLRTAILKSGITITEVLEGGCRGADRLGREWAIENNIPFRTFPARWYNLKAKDAVVKIQPDGKRFNIKAGLDRNLEMIKEADALIALRTQGKSNGTDHIIREATKAGLKVFVLHTESIETDLF